MVDKQKMNLILADIGDEYLRALKLYPNSPFGSGHEGYAVILEELDELWTEIKKYPKEDIVKMRKEALQVGAMALRFIYEVIDKQQRPVLGSLKNKGRVLFLPFAEQTKALKFSASSRVRARWVTKYWEKADYWDGKTDPVEWDVIIFQKFFQHDYQVEMAKTLKAMGKKIIFDICDAEWDNPNRHAKLVAMTKIADFTICSTFWLAEEMTKRYKANTYFIPDRQDLSLFPKVKTHREKKKPMIVWYGNQNTIQYVEQRRKVLETLGNYYDLTIRLILEEGFTLDLKNVTVDKQEWKLDTMNDLILEGDIVFNPHGTNSISLAKSDNKTTHAWALQMPVVTHGTDGHMMDQFMSYLNDYKLRQSVGNQGRKIVERYFNIIISVNEWKVLLSENNYI